MSDGLPRRRALLVEDEVLVAMIVEDYLQAIGFAPLCVGKAADALAALADGDFGLAVIDVGLPDARGDELATMVRELAPGLPIVMASGYDAEELRARFAGDEARRVLAKPYTENDLRAAVAEATARAFVKSS